MNSKRASKVLTASGRRCSANKCPSKRFSTYWPFASFSVPKIATMKSRSAMPSMPPSRKSINLTPQDFATGSPHPKPTAIKPSTTPLCRTKANGLRCKFVPTEWTMWRKADLQPIGNINPLMRKSKKKNSTLGSIPLKRFWMTHNPTRSTFSTP